MSLRLCDRNHRGEAVILLGNGGILGGQRRTQGLLRGMQLAARGAQVKIGLRHVEDEFLMGTGEGHVGDKGVCARGLHLGGALAEVEEQPFQRQRGNDFARIGDEIARRHQVSGHR